MQNIAKKPSRRKVTIFASALLVMVIICLVFILNINQPKPDFKSEKVIRENVAKVLGREPNELVDEDFDKIQSVYISQSIFIESLDPSVLLIINKDLADFKLLEKFTNLMDLRTSCTEFPENKIPSYMKFLAKVGIIDLKERFFLDLKSLGKLSKLKNLDLWGAPVKDIRPLSNLTKLEYLNLNNTHVSDLEPLMGLNNLKRLSIYGCENLKEQQIRDLQKALPELKIIR